MLVLITYDVNTQDAQGSRRLRKVAKVCVNYGQRVQNSVFECLLSPTELCIVRSQLLNVMDEKKDSLRIYNLGSSYKTRIEHYGVKQTYSPEDPIII